jgi:hypothetical protein
MHLTFALGTLLGFAALAIAAAGRAVPGTPITARL